MFVYYFKFVEKSVLCFVIMAVKYCSDSFAHIKWLISWMIFFVNSIRFFIKFYDFFALFIVYKICGMAMAINDEPFYLFN